MTEKPIRQLFKEIYRVSVLLKNLIQKNAARFLAFLKLNNSNLMKRGMTGETFNPAYHIIVIILASWLVFFVFFTIFDTSFFIILSLGLLFSIFYLIPIRSHQIKKRSEADLMIQNLDERRNLAEAQILQEKQATASFRDKIVNFSQLKELTEKLSMCLSLEDTSKTISEEVNKLFGSEDTTIILYLFHSKTGELGISASHKGQMRVNIKLKKGDIFDQWVVRTMQPLLIENTKSDYRFDIDKIDARDLRTIRSLVSVPLMVGHKALGILRVDSPKENNFIMEDLRFLTTIGDLGAVAIENAQLYERVEQLAIKDGLTGLYLRRYLLDRMSEEVNRHGSPKNPLSFFMFDLDEFKQYNDKFGHMAGDVTLRAVAKLIADFFKDPGNLISRYGGEEFSVLVPNCPKEKAISLAETIRKKISEKSILLRRQKNYVTVSIGVATFPQDAKSKEELIHKADLAMYKAKKKGRNRVCAA